MATYSFEHPEKVVSIANIQRDFWEKYGRTFFTRYDYEDLSSEKASKVVEFLEKVVSNEKDEYKSVNGVKIIERGNFSYTDIDGSVSKNQGLYFKLENGLRCVLRLSGTGSSGATIRLYVEKYSNEASDLFAETQAYLKHDIKGIVEFLGFKNFIGTEEPTVKT